MPRFHIEIDVECETLAEAEEYAERCLRPMPGFKHVTLAEEGALVTANPQGQRPNDGDGTPDYLQVFMVHAVQIELFKIWVEHHGWKLQEMPRFDMPAHHYTVTHGVNPSDAAMRAAGFTVPEKGTTDGR